MSELLNILLLKTNRYKVIRKAANPDITDVYQFRTERLIFLGCKSALLQAEYESYLFAEDILGQRFGLAYVIVVYMLSEVFKVSAVVEYEKAALIRILSVDTVNA